VEKATVLGGHVAHLNRTFPHLEEAEQVIGPRIKAVTSHPRTNVMAFSEVESIEGSIGNFRVKIRRKPRYIDEGKCNSCGECFKSCPVDVSSDSTYGLDKRKAIYLPAPEGPANLPFIDTQACLYFQDQSCDRCEKVCPQGAIDFRQQEWVDEIEVGTIIVATGHDIFDATKKTELGYGKYDQVITAPQFERLTSPVGPTEGALMITPRSRPSGSANGSLIQR